MENKVGFGLFRDAFRGFRVILRYAVGFGAARKLKRKGAKSVRLPVRQAEKCDGCKLCAKTCPANALSIHTPTDAPVVFGLKTDRCVSCGLCVESCPFQALQLQEEDIRVRR